MRFIISTFLMFLINLPVSTFASSNPESSSNFLSRVKNSCISLFNKVDEISTFEQVHTNLHKTLDKLPNKIPPVVIKIIPNKSSHAFLFSDGTVSASGKRHSGGIIPTEISARLHDIIDIKATDFSYAALRSDGSVITWGNQKYGGDSSKVSTKLSSKVKRILSNKMAFVAIKEDGSTISWGDPDSIKSLLSSLDSSSSSTDQESVDESYYDVYSTDLTDHPSSKPIKYKNIIGATASLYDDGTMVIYKHKVEYFGSLSITHLSKVLYKLEDIVDISASNTIITALRKDGRLIIWKDPTPPYLLDNLDDVVQIQSNAGAFAALKSNGSVFTFGSSYYGGDSSLVADKLSSGVKTIVATRFAFAALKYDGSVVSWGASKEGGDSSRVSSQLQSGVISISATDEAFSALKKDGSVVSWGEKLYGGNQRSVAKLLQSGVISLVASSSTFTALKNDGTLVSWGDPFTVKVFRMLSKKLINVKAVYTNDRAFVAVREDDSTISWGNPFLIERLLDTLAMLQKSSKDKDSSTHKEHSGESYIDNDNDNDINN